ncbi:MAG: hypothetical protein RJA35_1290 [Actinomycetota bacterium]
MFASSLGAISGVDNRLQFAKAKRVIVVLVDGLGAQNLKAAAGHAPFLNAAMAKTKPIACGFPSTTATSITSFGTGVSGGQHGLIGYKLYDRQTKTAFNLLNGWTSELKSEQWQPLPTVTQNAFSSGIQPYFIGPKAYEGSDFTRVTMAGATYRPGKTVADRFAIAEQLLRGSKDDSLTYLYVPELDQVAHAHGVSSDRWLAELEELDSQVRKLSLALSKGDAMLLTADHGVIDIQAHGQVYIDEFDTDWSAVANVSGDPRVNFVYLNDAVDTDRIAESMTLNLEGRGLALSKQQVIDAGWYGPVTNEAAQRMPEIFLLATKNVAFYHREYAPAASLNMIGQHGALSSLEMSIPLIGWGAFN